MLRFWKVLVDWLNTGDAPNPHPRSNSTVEDDPTKGLYTVTRQGLSDNFLRKWTALVEKAIAAGVAMNFDIGPEDDIERLKDRVMKIKAAIAEEEAGRIP